MPLHFAAARSTAHSPIARALARKAVSRAANDNGDGAGTSAYGSAIDTMMRAALRHFAEHGMGAAHEARRQAEQAHFDGDEAGYRWWLDICRALDRQLAVAVERRLESDCALIY